jgi:hypothetical protein
VALGLSFVSGCSLEASTQSALLSVHLTDTPAPFERLDVTISQIQVHRENTERWVSILDREQTIDLISLRDGVERKLQSLSIEPGSYDEFLIEVRDATLTQNGTTQSLALSQTTATVRYPFQLRTGDDLSVLLDFDAQASLRIDASGNATFAPQLKVKREARNK